MLDSPKENDHLERFTDSYIRWFQASNNAITAEKQGRKDEEIRLNQVAVEAFNEIKKIIKEEASKKGRKAFTEFRYLESIPQEMRSGMDYLMHHLLLALLDDLKE